MRLLSGMVLHSALVKRLVSLVPWKALQLMSILHQEPRYYRPLKQKAQAIEMYFATNTLSFHTSCNTEDQQATRVEAAIFVNQVYFSSISESSATAVTKSALRQCIQKSMVDPPPQPAKQCQ